MSQAIARSWRREAIAPAAAVLFLAAYALALAEPSLQRPLGIYAYNVPASVALCAVAVRAVRAARAGRGRSPWFAFAVALAAWLTADLIYSGYNSAGREAPFPGPADALYYLGYLALGVAVIRLGGVRPRFDVRVIADAGAVFLVAATFTWQYLVGPSASGANADLATRVVSAGYPVLDLTLLGALVVMVYGSPQPGPRPVLLLAASVALLVVTDFASTTRTLAGIDVAATSWLDLGWLASYWLMALAAIADRPATRPHEARAREQLWQVLLPYLAMLPLAGDVARRVAQEEPAGVPALGVVFTAALILGRQWLTLRDNARLQGEQETLNRVLQERVHELAEVARDAEEQRQRAEFLALHDTLTGLLNRRGWFAQAHHSPASGVCVLDLDDFKRLNDEYGHPIGDEVLSAIGQRLRELAPRGSIPARLGGEEFGILLFGHEADNVDACRRIVESIGTRPVPTSTGPLACTVSGGLATRASEATLENLYRQADAALYAAKANGKNRLVIARQAPRAVA